MVRTAGGVVSEARFSGTNLTPNREQMLWTVLNYLIDSGIDVKSFFEDINEEPDYYIYQLSQYYKIEDIAKRYGTTPDIVRNKIKNYVDKLFVLEKYMKEVENKLKSKEVTNG